VSSVVGSEAATVVVANCSNQLDIVACMLSALREGRVSGFVPAECATYIEYIPFRDLLIVTRSKPGCWLISWSNSVETS
jgi:hypothetical protein